MSWQVKRESIMEMNLNEVDIFENVNENAIILFWLSLMEIWLKNTMVQVQHFNEYDTEKFTNENTSNSHNSKFVDKT